MTERAVGDLDEVLGNLGVFPALTRKLPELDQGMATLVEDLNQRGLWKDVVLPSALPFIVTGVRLAVGRALVGVVIAEFYTSIAGLGFLIVSYANTFQTAKVFVPVVVLMALGVILTAGLQVLEGRLAPWQSRREAS